MYKYTNEKEIIEALERQAFFIEKNLLKNGLNIKDWEHLLPDLVTFAVHKMNDMVPIYYTPNLFELYEISAENFQKNPLLAAKQITFPGDFDKSIKLVNDHLMSEKQDLPVSFIQRLKIAGKQDFEGVFTVTKEMKGASELVSVGFKLSHLGVLGNKMHRVFEETLFVRKNYPKFKQLTLREKEIITLLALGYQNGEIAEQLFISKATVEQHRKNLKRKLEIKRFVELIRFAQAFDLI